MEQASTHASQGDPLTSASTSDLMSALAKQSGDLVKKEIALAKAEIRLDVKREVQMVEGLGVAAICGLAGLALLLAAAVLALAEVLPAWAAALVVAGAVLLVAAVAGAIGWKRRVKRPLDKTQTTLKEDARWLKGRVT